jgi:hypothetical protein
VITLAIRTPLAKAKKGGFKDTPLDALVFKILQQVVRRANIDPQLVEDVCLGNVRKNGKLSLLMFIVTDEALHRSLTRKRRTTAAPPSSLPVSLILPLQVAAIASAHPVLKPCKILQIKFLAAVSKLV